MKLAAFLFAAAAATSACATAGPEDASPDIITTAGYDTVRVGQPPDGAGHGLRDEGTFEESCRTYITDQLPSFYALAEDGIIQRVSIGQGWDEMPDSPLKTERGIGVGDDVAKVRTAYPELKQSPHTYTDGIYLDWLPGGEEAPGIRFEVTDDKVTTIHAGNTPAIFYVEGCA